MLFRTFVTNSKHALITSYKTYVRPLLEYCTIIWSPFLLADIDKVEAVQHYFTRRLFTRCNLEYVPYTERLRILNLESLELRRIQYDVIFVYKLLHKLVLLDYNKFFTYAPLSATRGHSYKLYHVYKRNNLLRNAFTVRAVPYWNCLSPEVVQCNSIDTFKKRVKLSNLSRFCKTLRNV